MAEAANMLPSYVITKPSKTIRIKTAPIQSKYRNENIQPSKIKMIKTGDGATIPINNNNRPLGEQVNNSSTDNVLANIKTTTISEIKSNYANKIIPTTTTAVARRNARERNRVKQVNNGFAILRAHIPGEVAEAYEAVGGRGAAKKLSKVETLRMAVEYIRSLEQLLDINTNVNLDSEIDQSENYSLNSFKSDELSPDETLDDDDYMGGGGTGGGMMDDDGCGNPQQNEEFYLQYSPTTNIAYINDRQFICIPGTNALQLVKMENDEMHSTFASCSSSTTSSSADHLHPNDMSLFDHNLTSTVPVTTSTHGDYLLDPTCSSNNVHIITPASISPNSYSRSGNGGGMLSNSPVLMRGNISCSRSMQHIEMDTAMLDREDDEEAEDVHESNLNGSFHYKRIYTMDGNEITHPMLLSKDGANNVFIMQGLPPIASIKKEMVRE